jgi:hypothetical protein
MLFRPPLLAPLPEGSASTDSQSPPDSVTEFKMGPPNIKADAKHIFNVIKNGGIAICPATVGYTLMTTNTEALEKMFTTKKRGAHKRYATGRTFQVSQEVHDLSSLYSDIIRTTEDFDLPWLSFPSIGLSILFSSILIMKQWRLVQLIVLLRC